MTFESPASRAAYAEAVSRRLFGDRHGEEPFAQRPWARAKHSPLRTALAAIAISTQRYDANALRAVLRLVAAVQAGNVSAHADAELRQLQGALNELGVSLRESEHGRFRDTLRGAEKPPVSSEELADMLAEIRRAQGV